MITTRRKARSTDGYYPDTSADVNPSRFLPRLTFLLVILSGCSVPGAAEKPNVLFIAIDDLNDWVGCLAGHPQARTPNLDRLASSGLLFTNAHCPAPACNPSRTAVFTGISPHRSGLYRNGQKMREVLPAAELLPRTFSRGGYWSAGSGKMLHYVIDARSWDDYFPAAETESPFPRTLYPDKRPLSLPRGGPWQYIETDWGPLEATDEEFGGDYLVADWVGRQLGKEHNKPFFLACGIYRPHEPWFVPRSYFEAFPLEKIQLPPGYRKDDLEDLPEEGQRMGPNRYFAHIQSQGQWKQAIQGYLASIYFADTMLGRVMEALENGPNADNTIVVLWSDHGWHLGEKQHWQKFTAWRACTRVPLIIRVPKGSPGLPGGTPPATCTRPVSLVSLAPTLLELVGLPPVKVHDGQSLCPLLQNPAREWSHSALTFLDLPGSYGLSTEQWRYIRYAGGGEELYDIQTDPYEWHNLATKKAHRATLEQMRAMGPKEFAPLKQPAVRNLPALEWRKLKAGEAAPPSRPDGNPFNVVFVNSSDQEVKLFWVDRDGGRKLYGSIAPGGTQRQQTRPGAIWMITDVKEGRNQPLGYFRVEDRAARAVVPGD